MNEMKLTSFKINALHSRLDYALKFLENRLILVGENGAGKTTVLRILFLFLSSQWSGLSKYDFKSISVTLNGKAITVSKSNLIKNIPDIDRILKRLPPPIRDRARMILTHNSVSDLSELEYMCDKYEFPFHVLMRELHSQKSFFEEDSLDTDISKNINFLKEAMSKNQILYLPTYRRIEQELSYIFTDVDMDEFKRRQRARNRRFQTRERLMYTELVEFGMNDVKDNIEQKLSYLKEFTRTKLNSLTLAYLGDVLDKKYDKVDVKEIEDVEDDTVKNILERIDPAILAKDSKMHLINTIKSVKNGTQLNEHQKVICHYFSKLLSFQQELEKEEQGIRRFCEVCNDYLGDKLLEYISSSFAFKVISKKHSEDIELSYLSSGEKQIVSLFSHLYLSENAKFFVMIDEPELSLSVPWQRKFLQDISTSDLCSGFLAVTHSPFIYENELEKYAHGLGEFIKDVK